MNAPCYRCTRRAVNCHAACQKYAEYAIRFKPPAMLNESLMPPIPSAATKSARTFARTACTTKGKDENDD